MSDRLPSTQSTTAAFEPELTKFDRRVLAALDPEPDYSKFGYRQREFRDAWEIGRLMREDDVLMVRRTLRGLEQLGYSWSRGWGYKQTWVATWRAREVL